MTRIGALKILSDGVTFIGILLAKLGAETINGLPIGQGLNNPFLWTPPPTNGQILIGNQNGSGAPTLGTITGSGGVSVSSSAGGINISGSSSGFSWTPVMGGTTTTMVANNGYVAAGGAGPAILVLPAASMLGDTFQVVGFNMFWEIQVAGSIYLITLGPGTRLDSTTGFDTITLVCVDSVSNSYVATATQGNINVS